MIETELELTKSNHSKFELNRIEEAIDSIGRGEIIIVVDDEDRENEGDFICAAEKITKEQINFMSKYGRGLICTPITQERADQLGLHMMVSNNTAMHETAFTVSIDYLKDGCTTGISAYDRSVGIKAMTLDQTKSSDFARPGHIFPLVAKKGGVLRRTGHTEAAVDLAMMAGLYPAGVLVEILKEDGSMARVPELIEIAKTHELKMISIEDLVAYRMKNERIVEEIDNTVIETKYGLITVKTFKQLTSGDHHFALILGDISENAATMVRVHSSSETGGIFGVLFSDSSQKMEKALQLISKEGSGVLLYMRQSEKIDAILSNIKTLSSESMQSIKSDYRDIGIGAQILSELGITRIKILTSSTKRRVALDGYGLEIVEKIKI